MTEALRQAIAQIEQLPEIDQDTIAQQIHALVTQIADQRWEELLADPRSEAFFDEMIGEVAEARNNGELLPWPHPKEN